MSTLDNKLINLKGLKHTYNKILDKTVVVFDMSNYMSGDRDYDSLSGLTKVDIAVAEYNEQKLSSTSINVGRDQFVITWISNDVNRGGLNYFTTKGKLVNGIYSITTDLVSYALLTQEEKDAFGSALDNVYTKAESEDKFQLKGSYASKSVEDEWNAFKSGVDNTQDVIDTLTEIQNYISSDIESFAKLSETVNTTSYAVNNTIPSTYATKDELNNLTFSAKEATEEDINIIMNSIK